MVTIAVKLGRNGEVVYISMSSNYKDDLVFKEGDTFLDFVNINSLLIKANFSREFVLNLGDGYNLVVYEKGNLRR